MQRPVKRGQRMLTRVGLAVRATARINNAAEVDMFRSNTTAMQTPKQKIKQHMSLTAQVSARPPEMAPRFIFTPDCFVPLAPARRSPLSLTRSVSAAARQRLWRVVKV